MTTAGAFALVAAGVQVGHSGGELVYRHGAAGAYADAAAPGQDGQAGDRPVSDDEERD